LKRLAEAGLVADAEAPAGADPRRRYYRITRDGRAAARVEAERWARTLQGARDKELLDERVSG
jgi:DNA-binding PadR family transcriptional regulator